MYQQITIDDHYLNQNKSMDKLSYGRDGLTGLGLSSKIRKRFHWSSCSFYANYLSMYISFKNQWESLQNILNIAIYDSLLAANHEVEMCYHKCTKELPK